MEYGKGIVVSAVDQYTFPQVLPYGCHHY